MAAPQVTIYFGSQSGTAEYFSEEIREEGESHGIACEVRDLSDFDPVAFITRKIVVLVVASYGDGEPTDNAVTFASWAANPNNDGKMKGSYYTVMGLGDMNYTKFNNMGKSTDLAFDRLGSKRLYRRGVGDDSQDIAEDFAKWKAGGLWDALRKAIAEVEQAGGFSAQQAAQAIIDSDASARRKADVCLFFGQEECDGGAQDVCECLAKSLTENGLPPALVMNVAERKVLDAVAKVAKNALVIFIMDCSPEGLCSAGRKLARRFGIELDPNILRDKDVRFVTLLVATSKDNNSAAALRPQIEACAAPLLKSIDRLGAQKLEDVLSYLDAGVSDVDEAIASISKALTTHAVLSASALAPPPVRADTPASAAVAAAGAPAAKPVPATPVVSPAKTRILVCGDAGKAAGERLCAAWPEASVEEASLRSLTSAVQGHFQVVIAAECAADGSLGDAAKGLLAQLGAAPLPIQMTLRQFRFFGLLAAKTPDAAAAAKQFGEAVSKFGTKCVASAAIDSDADDGKFASVCLSLRMGFGPVADIASPYPAAAAAPGAGPAVAKSGPVLHMAATAAELPAEVPGDPSDTVAKLYFEAIKTRVTKVTELRQAPSQENGLSTVEVEVEATGELKGYAAGGTLTLLPVCDPADVAAVLPLLGLSTADLQKAITFTGEKLRRPFPTPCLLGEALARYCDLGRAPTKKMLQVVGPKLEDSAARDRVAKLAADSELLKQLQAAPLCLRMHELWALLGVQHINPADFLLNCPRQKAREFTIASSPKAAAGRIALCVSLTSHEVSDLSVAQHLLREKGLLGQDASSATSRARFFGSCSKWLSSQLKVNDVVFAKQRPSPLRLPAEDVPVVMVGAGAGLAPFKGFWEELKFEKRSAPAALFFGCRNAEQDWIYRDAMRSSVKVMGGGPGAAMLAARQGPKPLTSLFTAFSRPGDGTEGCYVQDLIRKEGATIKQWIENMRGCVFICGSSAMGRGVLDALAEVLDGGKEAVDVLRTEGRVVAEMWG